MRRQKRTPYKRADMCSVLDGWRLIYCWMTDSTGLAVVIGPACRCTTFQVPSSGRKIVVTRRANGTISCLAPSLALFRSTHTTYASSGVTYLATFSKATISPSLTCEAARSIVAATCSHPRTGGPRGLARVTSSRWENTILLGSGFPFANSPSARWYCSTTSSKSNVLMRYHLLHDLNFGEKACGSREPWFIGIAFPSSTPCDAPH